MTYPSYPEYKNSGVAWLGQVPAHWEITKTKYHFDIQSGKMLQPQPNNANDEEIEYLAKRSMCNGVESALMTCPKCGHRKRTKRNLLL